VIWANHSFQEYLHYSDQHIEPVHFPNAMHGSFSNFLEIASATNSPVKATFGLQNSKGEVEQFLAEAGRITLSDFRESQPEAEKAGTFHSESSDPDSPVEDHGIMIRLRPHDNAIQQFLVLNTQIDTLNQEIRRREKLEKEREELLQKEQDARKAAENILFRKDRFIALISHELRSPLNAILGWVQLLKSETIEDEFIKNAIEVIERNATIQASLIQEIVDYERLISGKLSVTNEEVDLSELIHRSLKGFLPRAAKANVALKSDIEPGVFVFGDRTRLVQILTNLVENAFKFTPTGGEITVILRSDGKNAQMIVQDNGIGIEQSNLTKVFDRFYQVDNSTTRQSTGLGLGLAIVKLIVEQTNGSIIAESKGKGEGASFIVTLPRLHAVTDIPTTNNGSSLGVTLKNRSFLVVEDLPDARDVLYHLLTRQGANVQLAASAQEAIAQLDRKSFDLLISDIEMPEMDGYELIEYIRNSNTRYAHIPAIALTAHARPVDRERSFHAGYQIHISKPFNLGNLINTIHTLLQENNHSAHKSNAY